MCTTSVSQNGIIYTVGRPASRSDLTTKLRGGDISTALNTDTRRGWGGDFLITRTWSTPQCAPLFGFNIFPTALFIPNYQMRLGDTSSMWHSVYVIIVHLHSSICHASIWNASNRNGIVVTDPQSLYHLAVIKMLYCIHLIDVCSSG